MRSFLVQWLRHAAVTGIALALIGYVLAQAFLYSHRIYSGGAYNADNERVLWQTPVVMATIGIVICGGLELLLSAVRRPAPVPAPVQVPAEAER
jgi:H+/Cl- antiporter ClcA